MVIKDTKNNENGIEGVKPFWHEGIRFECQCSAKCCTAREDYGYVYLSGKDVRRLADYFQLDIFRFIEDYCETSDGYLNLTNPKTDCRFLKDTKCSIYEARPKQCRTWPFWEENLESLANWERDVASYCPGVGKGKLHSRKVILAIMGQD